MEYPDREGGGVMAEENSKEKVEGKERPKPPPGFRKFRKLLKRVINAPPLKKNISVKTGRTIPEV
jgi:hypothetical protein